MYGNPSLSVLDPSSLFNSIRTALIFSVPNLGTLQLGWARWSQDGWNISDLFLYGVFFIGFGSRNEACKGGGQNDALMHAKSVYAVCTLICLSFFFNSSLHILSNSRRRSQLVQVNLIQVYLRLMRMYAVSSSLVIVFTDLLVVYLNPFCLLRLALLSRDPSSSWW